MKIAKLLTILFISVAATTVNASIVTVDFNDLSPYHEIPDGYGGASHWSSFGVYSGLPADSNEPPDNFINGPEINFSAPVYFISADFTPWGGFNGPPTYEFFLHDQLVYTGPAFWSENDTTSVFPKSKHQGFYNVTSDYHGPVDRMRFWAGSEGNQFDNLVYSTTAPVPEPEAYAMFLAGLGLMGIAARRKRLAA